MIRKSLALLSVLLLSTGSFAQDKGFTVDKEKKTITIPVKVAPRKLPHLEQSYPIEVISARRHEDKGEKAHETVVTQSCKPSDVHKALEELGLKPGKPAKGEAGPATGPEVKIFLEIPSNLGGDPRKVPIERTLVDKKTGKPLPALKWMFTGSVQKQPDPDKPDKVYGADSSGTLIAVFPVTDECVFQSHLTKEDESLLKMDTDKKLLPPEGADVKLIIEVK